MCFINEVGLQSQQVQSGIVDWLGNYQGSDNNEPVKSFNNIFLLNSILKSFSFSKFNIDMGGGWS